MSTPVQSINKSHLRPLPSRIKRVHGSDRLKRIRDLASELLDHSEALKHEGEMAATSATIVTLDSNSTIDFYEEVRRFEVQLIKRALELVGGSQVRAAQLLGLEANTLNYKVKTYGLAVKPGRR